MNDDRLKLLLLPGLDGTGMLFADFAKLLPNWIEPRVVNYPSNQKLTYDQLLPIVKSALPSDEPFVILAESFSTPLAVRIAAQAPRGLRALVLCAGFVSSPRRDFLSRIALVLAPALVVFGLPKNVCRRFLVGSAAPKSLVDRVCSIVSTVSSGVLVHRFMSVFSCDCRQALQSVSVPLLYVAGSEDRLVPLTAFTTIRQAKSDLALVTINAPHLVLQANPRESVGALLQFLSSTR